MLVTVESTGTLERRMRIELPGNEIEKEVETRLKKVGQTAKLKGFRPGKIPANVVRQRFGGEVRQEVLTALMEKSYRDALIQEKLNPAGNPVIAPEPIESGNDFVFVATFEVMPEVTLKGLDKIKVERAKVEIGDADCDDMLENLRKQKADWKTVERKSAEDDRIVVDFVGKLDGVAFEGGTGTEVPVVLGQGQMLPDFEKALYGISAGDEKTFKVKFPKDYRAEELAGKKAEFEIKVHRVEEQELPPLDDALAEAFGISEGGLEKLRSDVTENMHRQLKQKLQGDIKEQAMNGLIEANPIEVPKTLVDQESHSLQHDAMNRMGVTDHDQAPPREQFAELGERRVRLGILLNQVIVDNKIEIDADRVRAKIEEICAGYENSAAMVANYLGNPQVMSQIQPMVLEEQAIDWLVSNGQEAEKKISFKDYMNS